MTNSQQQQSGRELASTLSALMVDTINKRGDDRAVAPEVRDADSAPPPPYSPIVDDKTDFTRNHPQYPTVEDAEEGGVADKPNEGSEAAEEETDQHIHTSTTSLPPPPQRPSASGSDQGNEKAERKEESRHLIEIDASTHVKGRNNLVSAQTLEQNSLLGARIVAAITTVLQGPSARPIAAAGGAAAYAPAHFPLSPTFGGDNDRKKSIHVRLQCNLLVEGEGNMIGGVTRLRHQFFTHAPVASNVSPNAGAPPSPPLTAGDRQARGGADNPDPGLPKRRCDRAFAGAAGNTTEKVAATKRPRLS